MVHIFGKSTVPGASPARKTATDSGEMPAVFDVTTETFENDVIRRSSSVPVLLDMWAKWCGPCRELGPRLEKLARGADGAFVLAKIDIDANQEVAALFGVRSIPAVILFKGGRPLDAFMGSLPEQDIERFLAQHIAIKKPMEEPKAEQRASVEDALEAGDVQTAAERIDSETDRILAARVRFLAGDLGGAKSDYTALDDGARASALDQVEALGRLIDNAEQLADTADWKLADLKPAGLKAVLDGLLELKTPEAMKVFLDLLTLMGRGEFSDSYRTKLARTLFS